MTAAAGHRGGPLTPRPYDRDDDLLAAVRRDGATRVRVIRWDSPAVVIGRGGRQREELDTAAVAADGVPLLQRRGGGCSVVLDPGNLVVSAVVAAPGLGGITSAFAACSGWVIAVLAAAGIAGVEHRGVSDLALGDRKVGGSCIWRTRGLLYYSATLLIDPDLNLIDRYLRYPPREPQYRRGRSHREFLGSLRLADPELEIEPFTRRLQKSLTVGLIL